MFLVAPIELNAQILILQVLLFMVEMTEITLAQDTWIIVVIIKSQSIRGAHFKSIWTYSNDMF